MKRITIILATILLGFFGACERVEVILPEVASVAISASAKTLAVGESCILSAHVVPSNADNTAISWSSSDTKVVTVSEGTVKAIAPGTATVIATSANGKMAECKITVVEKDVAVQGISLNTDHAEILVGETVMLTVSVTPSDAKMPEIFWSVDREDIAIAVNGLVKGLKRGTANVTASTSDGKFKASCILDVIENVDSRDADAETEKIGDTTDYTWTY